MLIDFRFQNHRSVRDEQAFTFEAAYSGGEGDQRSRTVPGWKKSRTERERSFILLRE